ncbi:MAG: hypothetical protein IPH84_18890 [Bacteroidales bacterium]|nr:hypothetical protein [Bacteroidales bacterium]
MKTFFSIAVTLFITLSAFSQNSNNNVFDNAPYVRLGYAIPGGTLKTDEVINAGGQLEVGTLFYINALKLPDQLKLGVDVTYLSLNGLFNKKSASENNETVSFFAVGAKLGPCLSYNPGGEFITDLYFKVFPNYFIVGQKDVKYTAENQFKLGTSFGLNIRWKALMIGCEFTSNNYDFEVSLPDASRSATLVEERAIKLPVTNISLGVNF